MSPSLVDVAIIGLGPAGATLANLLGQLNLSVVVLERETFPRYHIGESISMARSCGCLKPRACGRSSKPFRARV